MFMKIIDQAHAKALEVLRACARPQGWFASGLKGGYEAVWARDSMITSLGAALSGVDFSETSKRSLELLSRNQSLLGQIPNCVGSYNTDRKSDVTFNSIDSSLWYVIGFLAYALTNGDREFYLRRRKNLTMALIWLSYQDPDEVRLLAQQPTMDWQDAFPHKYGYTINTQALYYAVLKLAGKNRQAEHMKKIINGERDKYLSLYDKQLGFYYPWAWKNHDGEREHEQWFDSLGNLLAIVSGLATPAIARSILNHIDREKINRPYPVKALWPPIKEGDREWKSYFSKCDARQPLDYLNGGIWPMIGAWYVAALVKTKQDARAQKELVRLAQANLQKLKGHEFNEWLQGGDGTPRGEPYQAWSAGAYLYAYQVCQKKKIFFFD